MSTTSSVSRAPDILIAGAGIIGLSLALELHLRGARVTILERNTALAHASTAAAGMLAAEDPHHPDALRPLARFSASLYPQFLKRIESLSKLPVPVQTEATLEYQSNGSIRRIAEHSIDPRQLAAALLAAVRGTSIDLREHTPAGIIYESSTGITVPIPGSSITAQRLVYTMGAWTPGPAAIFPRKGQMLRVQIPKGVALNEVHRSEAIYIVPRTQGPQAGTALIGATEEDAGFNTATHAADLAHLRSLAANLLPAFASELTAPILESWAGLRPATPDALPILGVHTGRQFLATGHFRNGILLAPATAVTMADLIEGKNPSVDLTPFSPQRFE